jgi:hypothetical protein
MRLLGCISVIMFFFACNALASSKIDTIYFQNGDRITAEVKSLANNQLQLSTDDAKTINVQWDKVDSVQILNNMRILLKMEGSCMERYCRRARKARVPSGPP